MSEAAAYLLVFRKVTDPEGASRYLEAAKPLGESFGATYLIRGAVPTVLEGDKQLEDGEAVVLIRFPSREAAEQFSNSDEYAPLRELAKRSFVRTMWLLDGIPGAI